MIKNWNELDLKTYYEVYKTTTNALLPEDEKRFRCTAILAGITYDELMEQPIERTMEMVADSAFLYYRPTPQKVRKTIDLNGRTYCLTKDASSMSTSQYIDYNAVIVEKYEEHICDLLSIILVPKGHNYNDGYDMEEVRKDMESMSVTEALGITDFFLRLYRRSLRRTLLYSSAAVTLMRIRAPKEMKKELKEMERQYSKQVNELLTMCGNLSLKQLLN